MKRNIITIALSAVVSAALILPAFGADDAQPASNDSGIKLNVINKPKAAAKDEVKEKQDSFDIQSLNSPSPCILQSLRFISPQALPMLASRLKLTADQEAKVKDLFDKSEEAAAPLVRNQKVESESFVKGLAMSQLKEADISAAAKSAMDAELAIVNEKVKALFALRQILTPAQNTELDALIKSQSAPWIIGRPAAPDGTKSAPVSDE